METLHSDDPLSAYLEGQGSYELNTDDDNQPQSSHPSEPQPDENLHEVQPFAPSGKQARPRVHVPSLQPIHHEPEVPQSALTRAHHAWSTAWNSRLGRVENAKFLEHFRYTIVASQLLNEYLDHGSLNPTRLPRLAVDGAADEITKRSAAVSIQGAAATAVAALALVYLIQWSRTRRGNFWTKSRITFVLTLLAIVAFAGYQYGRRQWLKSMRQQAVSTASNLVTNWQAFELSSSSALSFIQEVELVSKGYRLSTPLPPVSRIEESGTARRCAKLRRALNRAFSATIPAYIEACTQLRLLIDDDDLERYFDVYDISIQDAKEVSGKDALNVLEEDAESLKSLRVLSYRSGILRRVTLCSLMALEADGGKPDIHRWDIATNVMVALNQKLAASAERIRASLSEMEHFNLPATPARHCQTTTPKEKMRSQVRKISALSSGIRGLQAKMQILREETNKAIEHSEDLTDLGPHLMAQYESIGGDLRELIHAWEMGKQSLQTNITRQERRISMASSGFRSPMSSLSGLTAVEEVDGSPSEALKALNGELQRSNRSSMATTPSDEEQVFEAIALPRQRPSNLTREERIMKMHEERERQATLRAKRDANTSMLRELESVINLRPKKVVNGAGAARVTSL